MRWRKRKSRPPVSRHDQMLDMAETLQRVLAQMANQREGDHDWVLAEQNALFVAQLMWAHKHGLKPLSFDRVVFIDRVSTGADWGHKVCLRIAQEVYG